MARRRPLIATSSYRSKSMTTSSNSNEVGIEVCLSSKIEEAVRYPYDRGCQLMTFMTRVVKVSESILRQSRRGFIGQYDLTDWCRVAVILAKKKMQRDIDYPFEHSIPEIKELMRQFLRENGTIYDFSGSKMPVDLVGFDQFLDVFYPHASGFDYSIEQSNEYYGNLKRRHPMLRYLGDERLIRRRSAALDWNKCRAGQQLALHGSFYFHPQTRIGRGDVVFDVGAAPGDFTSVSMGEGAGEVHAFEPDHDGQEKLRAVMELNGEFIIAPFFVGEIDNSSNRQISLDSYCKENRIDNVDFIKVDIEGAERSLLRGARRVLLRDQPKLVICTYHLINDQKILPRIILNANPEYRIVKGRSVLYACVPES